MKFSRVYLDTNIFLRAFEGSQTDDIAKDIVGLFGLSARAPATFVTSQLTLAEALVHPLRDGNTNAQRRYELLLANPSPWLHVQPVEKSILVDAAHLRAAIRLKLPDAIHLATALQANCSHILSSDADFDMPGKAELPMSIRPDRATLDALSDWLRR